MNAPAGSPLAAHGDATLATRLARFALRLQPGDLTEPRRAKVALILADFIGCVLAGSTLPEADSGFVLAQPGEVRIPGVERPMTAETAAIAMATLGSLLQLHDGYGNGGNHPSCGIIPAVWCIRGGHAMQDVRMAIAVGYEIANRIAHSAHPQLTLAGMAPTSATGAIGATAAIGRLLGLAEDVVARAISIAAFSFPVAALRGLTEHGSVVPLHGGLAGRCAIEAIRLAQAGLSAGATVLEGGDDPGTLALLHSQSQGLASEGWRGETLDGVYFKPIPACRHAQPPIDAIEAIWRQGPLDPAQIERVDVHTYPVALRFGKRPGPAAELYDRLMSVTWCVASALRHGKYDVDNILAPTSDRELERLCDAIRVHIDPEYGAIYPRELRARVEITLRGGDVRTGLCRMQYGTPSQDGPYSPAGTNVAPLDRAGVRAKFDRLAQRRLTRQQADALWDEIHAD